MARRTAQQGDTRTEGRNKRHPESTVTLTAYGIGTVYQIVSDRDGHRAGVTSGPKTEVLAEWPVEDWAAAARYVVNCVDRELRDEFGERQVTRCGDCGAPMYRDHDGTAICPTDGKG